MSARGKQEALLFMIIALIAMLLLAGGLSGLEFLPGDLFSLWQRWMTDDTADLLGINTNRGMALFLKIAFTLLLVLLPFAIILIIVSPDLRRKMLRDLFAMLPILIMLYLIVSGQRGFQGQPVTPVIGEESATQLPVSMASNTNTISNAPFWLPYFISFGLALFIILLVAGLLWLFWRRPLHSPRALESLAEQARRTLGELYGGSDLRETIIRCYAEMERIAKEQRGLWRLETMTVREFKELLQQAGLPPQPVGELTRLFEVVRYGAQSPGLQERQSAIDCLSAIAAAFQEKDR